MFADSISQNDLHFCGIAMAKLIKLAKMACVMHEPDEAYNIQSTWRLHRLATDAPFVKSVPC